MTLWWLQIIPLHQVHILRDKGGKQSIPSIVGFVGSGSVVTGHAAEKQIKTNPLRTIYDAKRFIGRNFTQVEKHSFPSKKFKIFLNVNELKN